MRVLAVGELEVLLEHGRGDGREGLPLGEPGGDRRLVGGRRRECGRAASRRRVSCRARPLRAAQRAPTRSRRASRLVRHARSPWLRRGSIARPPDVDHLDRLLLADAAPARDPAAERVQVDADEVEGPDPVLGQRRHVGPRPRGGRGCRHERAVSVFYPAAEHLRVLGQLLDPRHRETELLDRVGGAAACDQLPVERREPLRERVQPGLVPDGDQRLAQGPSRPRAGVGARRRGSVP